MSQIRDREHCIEAKRTKSFIKTYWRSDVRADADGRTDGRTSQPDGTISKDRDIFLFHRTRKNSRPVATRDTRVAVLARLAPFIKRFGILLSSRKRSLWWAYLSSESRNLWKEGNVKLRRGICPNKNSPVIFCQNNAQLYSISRNRSIVRWV